MFINALKGSKAGGRFAKMVKNFKEFGPYSPSAFLNLGSGVFSVMSIGDNKIGLFGAASVGLGTMADILEGKPITVKSLFAE